ncbi:unnamed protein product [Linum tenue]|uniref:Homeobox domain-containing protein n=1 Tax=Linum tenue TaxID=586396 RepID=A0AAV0JSX0_9ROSI|nr:unnamed protein product [Linum tenue]
MMLDKEDLGLSLSLSFPSPHHHHQNHHHNHHTPLHLNLMPSSSSSSAAFLLPHSAPAAAAANHPKSSSWISHAALILNPSSDPNLDSNRGETTRSFLRGIDVNRLPAAAAADCEEEVGVSSPNSTVSSISGKRSERDQPATTGSAGEDLDAAGSRGGISDEEDGDTSRKKLRLSKDQSAVLEESFKEHNTLNPKQKTALAKQLGLRPRQVEVWFQNRRARTKLKQTEVDCEFLKRCCENLTEENRRLQKEVQELRALKLSPQFYMQMTPPTTLTMCPSCERVAVPPSSTSSAPASTSSPPVVAAAASTAAASPLALMGSAAAAHHHRSMAAINPWAAGGPFNVLRPRS